MPAFSISVINKDFEARNEQELPSLEAARAEAIKGALQIGISEVSLTNPFFAAEVKIEGAGNAMVRYVVSLGVSPLR